MWMPERGGVRPAVLAGRWYPGDPTALARAVRGYLDDAPAPDGAVRVSAIVAPHAGYVYSGPIAGVAWKALAASIGHRAIRRVVLVAPAHRVPFRGVALGDYRSFVVPTGTVQVDRQALAELEAAGLGVWVPEAHVEEHAIEIELPFLVEVFARAAPAAAPRVVPLLMGRVDHMTAKRAIDLALGPEDVLVVSTDLSHYLPYDVARAKDLGTLAQVVALDDAGLDGEAACGHRGLGAALDLAKERGWQARLLDYRSSGDTAGDRDAVVGYGAVALGCPEVHRDDMSAT